ncbi:MAG: ImmA/IrrE family metallo-endopeptidase [Acidimicrobiaceae bacterium]|nr:ImmA/IrrE family metallo-endopeptidase [Acidimicrobiaceae bacterium]
MLWRRAIRRVADQMVDLVAADALTDLQIEDPASAVEVHFPPVRVRCLPSPDLTRGDCSVDGYYEPFLDPEEPQILYSGDVIAQRARFTVMHELGHHLLNTTGSHLLDDLDRLGGSARGACEAEEAACDRFAGNVIVPAAHLAEIIGSRALMPRHLLKLREVTDASWEALAVRTADYPDTKTAVILLREPGEVSFVASAGLARWRRGSLVQPDGPLDRALARNTATADKDIYRYGLGGAEALFCDTARIDERLAVAVMSARRSDGRLSILEPVEPVWKTRDEFCPWCNEERDVGWCHDCAGRRCRTCRRCGCLTPIKNPVCPQCHLEGPFWPGSSICRDCEAAGPSQTP